MIEWPLNHAAMAIQFPHDGGLQVNCGQTKEDSELPT